MNKDYITELLMKIDTEISSTINFADDKETVINNMVSANLILHKIKNELDIEF